MNASFATIKYQIVNVIENKQLSCYKILPYSLLLHTICCFGGVFFKYIYINGNFALISICHYMYLFSIHVLYCASFKKKQFILPFIFTPNYVFPSLIRNEEVDEELLSYLCWISPSFVYG